MRTSVSIPDDVFRRVEHLARQRKVSRSQVYTAALIGMLEAEAKDELTRAYDVAFADHRSDRFTNATAPAALASIQWSHE